MGVLTEMRVELVNRGAVRIAVRLRLFA